MANRKMIKLTHQKDGKTILVDANSIKLISEDESGGGSVVVLNENLVRIVTEPMNVVEDKIEKFFKG